MEQPRSGAVRQRFLRDQLCRKFVVEIGDQHDSDYRDGPSRRAAARENCFIG
jgi:hypothetical protein